MPPSEFGTRLVSWPNKVARTMAPRAITPSTSSELVPAPARTAGITNTPVPMMLPTTSPVAEVTPRARAFCSVLVDAGPSCAPEAGGALAVVDMETSSERRQWPESAHAVGSRQVRPVAVTYVPAAAIPQIGAYVPADRPKRPRPAAGRALAAGPAAGRRAGRHGPGGTRVNCRDQ